jgi:hypothetical protein
LQIERPADGRQTTGPCLRRLPPPWTVEELDACFIVRDRGGQNVAHVYFEDEAGKRVSAPAYRFAAQGMKLTAHFALERLIDDLVLLDAGFATKRGPNKMGPSYGVCVRTEYVSESAAAPITHPGNGR